MLRLEPRCLKPFLERFSTEAEERFYGQMQTLPFTPLKTTSGVLVRGPTVMRFIAMASVYYSGKEQHTCLKTTVSFLELEDCPQSANMSSRVIRRVSNLFRGQMV